MIFPHSYFSVYFANLIPILPSWVLKEREEIGPRHIREKIHIDWTIIFFTQCLFDNLIPILPSLIYIDLIVVKCLLFFSSFPLHPLFLTHLHLVQILSDILENCHHLNQLLRFNAEFSLAPKYLILRHFGLKQFLFGEE